ncbi:CLUMA_CG007543, isoform A [Clunio marinus]|uniref:CLUMA_CG007543, isoform A n=1 Tax=Clunio marinus TaxID=568069 RepID=A0A1J1I2M3_9DIPT|nr:CLUMA_CG007543, isoform A [Clunio marinus]
MTILKVKSFQLSPSSAQKFSFTCTQIRLFMTANCELFVKHVQCTALSHKKVKTEEHQQRLMKEKTFFCRLTLLR